jgi:N-acetylglucosaminyl-diphospho-decaprenol L-rhamnosyltransferase
MNPDIKLDSDPFPSLLACLQNKSTGVAAPVVINDDGKIEDSARCFPTPLNIICKALGGCKANEYVVDCRSGNPDWVAGMFMLFPADVFAKLGGFDQRYFLYYEDVDLCVRLRLIGYEVAINHDAKVIHNARRSSHHDLRYLKWHIASMLRFFFSPQYFKIRWLRLSTKSPRVLK